MDEVLNLPKILPGSALLYYQFGSDPKPEREDGGTCQREKYFCCFK
jgi:hypothetical protein